MIKFIKKLLETDHGRWREAYFSPERCAEREKIDSRPSLVSNDEILAAAISLSKDCAQCGWQDVKRALEEAACARLGAVHPNTPEAWHAEPSQ